VLQCPYSDFLEIIIPQVEAIQTTDHLVDARADLVAFTNVGRVFNCSAINSSLMHYTQRTQPFQLNSEETVDSAHRCCDYFDELLRDVGAFKDKFDNFSKFISGVDTQQLDQAINEYVESLIVVPLRVTFIWQRCLTWITGLRIAGAVTASAGVVGICGGIFGLIPISIALWMVVCHSFYFLVHFRNRHFRVVVPFF
jgi:hypothetical protein